MNKKSWTLRKKLNKDFGSTSAIVTAGVMKERMMYFILSLIQLSCHRTQVIMLEDLFV